MKNPIVSGKLRFTVIDEVCIRIEYCENGIFCDEPTLFAANREVRYNDFKKEVKNHILSISTPMFKVTCETKAASPRAGALRITCGNSTWSWGKKNNHNLGSAIQSLDGCSAPMKLDDGLLSRDGWYVIDDSGTAILPKGWIAPRPAGGANDFDIYYFGYGTDYKKALKALAKISGSVPLIPRFLMGSWYSRWYHYTSEDYRNIVREYHDNGFPLDNIVMDMEWHTREGETGFGWAGTLGWTGWNWNRELLPDAEKLLDEFKKDNLQVAMNVHPADGIRTHEHCYRKFMKALGENPDEGKDLPFADGDQAYMNAWYKYAHSPYEKQGCSIWWVDWQQDCIYPWVSGVPGTKHVPWLNTCYYNHMSTGGRRGISFSRWGGWGDQKHPIHFSGDTIASWDVLAFEIAFTETSGNALCFFWSHDMGGFCGKRNEELYARWLQFGSVSAAMRLHSAGDDLDRRPWKWAPVFRESMRKSFRRRAALMPYLYTAMRNSCRDSVPMIRALYIDHPEDELAYNNMGTFYVGDDMTAAPVTAPGEGDGYVAMRSVYIPEGEWFRMDSGERFTAGEHVTAADIDELPLFVRAGVPIPLAPAETDRIAQQVSDFEIQLFPASDELEHAFTLYEDDGVSDKWKKGESAETIFRAKRNGNQFRVTVGKAIGTYDQKPKRRTVSLCLKNIKKVLSVKTDGKSVKFDFDKKNHTVRTEKISLSAGAELVWKIEAEVMDQKQIKKETAARLVKKAGTEQMKQLVTGTGAFVETEPLTGKKFITVLPGKTKTITCISKINGTILRGELAIKGSHLFRLPMPEKDDRLQLEFNGITYTFQEEK